MAAYSAILGAVVFWGMSFVGTGIVFRTYGPLTTIFLRLVALSLLLFGLRAVMRRLGKGETKRPSRRQIGQLLPLALFQPFLYFLGEGYGIDLTSSTVASVVISTIPVVTPLFAVVMVREKVRVWGVAGALLSFCGVAIMIVVRGRLTYSAVGVLALVGAVLAAVAYFIVVKLLDTGMSALTVVSYQNVFGAAYFLPLFLLVEGRSFLGIQPPPQTVLSLVLLAVFSSTLAFVFNTYAVRELGVARSSIFLNGVPVVTAGLSFLLLSEPIGVRKVIGIVVVIVGVVMAQLRRARPRPGAAQRGEGRVP